LKRPTSAPTLKIKGSPRATRPARNVASEFFDNHHSSQQLSADYKIYFLLSMEGAPFCGG
jgi:hypothetical protein